jgi:sterol O-acyltransferase
MASMVFTHFLLLHVVQNIFGELTRFADRDFYGDWWNCRSFAVYYRKWNGIVHEFIHAYLYSDLVSDPNNLA